MKEFPSRIVENIEIRTSGGVFDLAPEEKWVSKDHKIGVTAIGTLGGIMVYNPKGGLNESTPDFSRDKPIRGRTKVATGRIYSFQGRDKIILPEEAANELGARASVSIFSRAFSILTIYDPSR